MAWSAFTEEYALAAVGGDLDLSGDALMATFADSIFLGWFVFLTLFLHDTAAIGSPRVQRLPLVRLAAALGYQPFVLLRSDLARIAVRGPGQPPRVPAIADPAPIISAVLAIVVGLCLLASVYELSRLPARPGRGPPAAAVAGGRRRAAGPASRRVRGVLRGLRLRGVADHGLLHHHAVAGRGLSVVSYRLYDVERVVTDSSAYALSTGAVLAAFGLFVLAITSSIPPPPLSSLPSAPTLAATGARAAGVRLGLVRVDRRFNRRRFDAVRVVERRAGRRARRTSRSAVPHRVRRPAAPSPVFARGPGAGSLPTAGLRRLWRARRSTRAARRGDRADRVRPGRTDAGVVEAVRRAAAEIDNVALRAELARQVELIDRVAGLDSPTAHLEERRRIERDLHDGAQQRLLAIALQLQSARVNGDRTCSAPRSTAPIARPRGRPSRSCATWPAGCSRPRSPAAGCTAAVDDLAGRIPLRIRSTSSSQRSPRGSRARPGS